MQRSRMFKDRGKKRIIREISLRVGRSGLISLRKQRFELIYLRFIKRLLRKRYMRRKNVFIRKKYWFFLRPNVILTGKSTNSRMGAGVGSLVRIAILLESYKSFVEFKYYSSTYLKYINMALRHRLPIIFKFYSR